MTQRPVVAVFARAPIPGLVKTRLAATLGQRRAAQAYGEILRDVLVRLQRLRPEWRVIAYASRRRDRGWFESRFPGLEVRVQHGRDLGQRLRHAFQELFAQGHERVLVVGSDIPELDVPDIVLGGERLTERPVVLGPGEDGGYYLIGQRAPGVELFEGVAWGSPAVLLQTIRRVRRHALRFAVLPRRYDVDRLRDWERYRVSRMRPGSPFESAT